ncbi:hypothetical protein ACHAPJ_006923 [Fusarium lateritium]
MAEQEGGQASNQAQNHTQNRPQNEGQGSASGSRGGSRGGRRRGRGGRNRGQRQDGSTQGSRGRGNASSQTDSADTAVATPSTTVPTEPAASAAPESSGASRGRRNRRGNRGGARGSGDQGRGTFSVGPRRQFGGRLTTTQESTEAAAQDPSLSAAAPEFVPGQPVSQRGNLRPGLSLQPSLAQEELAIGTENKTDPAKRSPSLLLLNFGNEFKKILLTGTTNAASAPKKLLAKQRLGHAQPAGQLFISSVPTNGGTLL